MSQLCNLSKMNRVGRISVPLPGEDLSALLVLFFAKALSETWPGGNPQWILGPMRHVWRKESICLEQVLVRHRGQKATVKRKTFLLTDQQTSEG